MCGIIAAFNAKKDAETVNKFVMEQLEDQLSRGKEGFGMVWTDSKGKIHVERSTELTKALVDLRLLPSKGIVLHHRFPTSTPNAIKQTHPILVSNAMLQHDYLVVHNGVISNDADIFDIHQEEGWKYTTEIPDKVNPNLVEFNDSECLAIEVAKLLDSKGYSHIMRTKGSAAFVALQIDKINGSLKMMAFGRNTINPLHMHTGSGYIRLSSEGIGKDIDANTLYTCNPRDLKLEKKLYEFAPSYSAPKVTPEADEPDSRDCGYHDYGWHGRGGKYRGYGSSKSQSTIGFNGTNGKDLSLKHIGAEKPAEEAEAEDAEIAKGDALLNGNVIDETDDYVSDDPAINAAFVTASEDIQLESDSLIDDISRAIADVGIYHDAAVVDVEEIKNALDNAKGRLDEIVKKLIIDVEYYAKKGDRSYEESVPE